MKVLFRLSCAERDSMLLDPDTGLTLDNVGIVSTCTDDADRSRTVWDVGEGFFVEDVWYPRAAGSHVVLCDHHLLSDRGVG